MKTRILIYAFTLIASAILLSSFCFLKKPKHPYGKKLKAPKTYAYIPSGKLMISKTQSIEVRSFFMSKGEVSNLDYNEFLADLLRQGKTEEHEIARQKPEFWETKPWQETYHRHPSYEDYPVLTISKEGANLYCQWLTKIWNAKNIKYKVQFRLPTEHEWVYAARGGHEYAPYPWGGYYLRNAKGKVLANFRRLGSGNIHFDRKNDKYEVVGVDKTYPESFISPAPVISYLPNDYGLFNMVGNAAEMISTENYFSQDVVDGHRTKGGCYDSTGYDIRIDSEDEFAGWTEPSQYIGFRPIMEVSLK